MIKKAARNSIFIIISIIVSLFLVSVILNITSEKLLLSEKYHSNIFKGLDIYDHTYNYINKSLNQYTESLKNDSPDLYSKYSHILEPLKKSISKDMVKSNIINIENELIDYIKGKRQTLPDIVLNNISVGSNDMPFDISKIQKINTSILLNAINRSDIEEYLSFARFLYFLEKSLNYLFLAIIFIFVAIIIQLNNFITAINYFKLILKITAGIFTAITLLLFVYSKTYLNMNIIPFTMSLPFDRDLVYSYFKILITNFCMFLIIFSLILIGISIFLEKLKYFSKYKMIDNYKIIFRNICKYAPFLLLIAFVTFSCFFIFNYKNNISSVELPEFISRIQNMNSTKQVIYAKDASIYSLDIKVIDKLTLKPVESQTIKIKGKIAKNKTDTVLTAQTDYNGTVHFDLGKGTFHLSFEPESFNSFYKMPTPFSFEIENFGIKSMTIELEQNEKMDQPIF